MYFTSNYCFFKTTQKLINGLVDFSWPAWSFTNPMWHSDACVYSNQLLCHCVYIYSDFHWQNGFVIAQWLWFLFLFDSLIIWTNNQLEISATFEWRNSDSMVTTFPLRRVNFTFLFANYLTNLLLKNESSNWKNGSQKDIFKQMICRKQHCLNIIDCENERNWQSWL